MPYAGSAAKVINVSSREAYRRDHHRNLFNTDKKTPFNKNAASEWSTTQTNSFAGSNGYAASQAPAAGGAQVV